MTNIVFKAAPRGEGKTRWLVEKARIEHDQGSDLFYVITNLQNDYFKFCSHYFAVTGHICPVKVLENIEDLSDNSVILIDDLLTSNVLISQLTLLRTKCKKIYATIEGEFEV